MEATTYIKTIRQLARNDFEVLVNGEVVGYASTRMAAQSLANEFVAQQIEWAARCEAEAAQVVPATQARPALVTKEALADVIADTVEHAPADRRWRKALEKAAERLYTVRWSWEPTSARLLIHSATTAGQKYVVSAGMCDTDCGAAQNGRPCWHRVARTIVARAALRASVQAAA